MHQREIQTVPPERILQTNDGSVLIPDASAIYDISDGDLVFDFGSELFGDVRFAVLSCSIADKVPLRVSLGESVGEVMSRCYFQRMLEVTAGEAANVGTSGFRFARIQVLQGSTRVEVGGLFAESRRRRLSVRGSFQSSDARLNRIWMAGAETVHLCMQTDLWDGIKRGQTVWAGDLFPAAMVVNSVFGVNEIVPRSLDRVRDDSMDAFGRADSWMNGISTYSLWWILTHERWFLYHGRLEYLREQFEYLRSLLMRLFSAINHHGAEVLDGWRFFDWATAEDEKATHAGLQSLMILAMRAAARICDLFDDYEFGDRCRSAHARLIRHVPPAGVNKQANALQVLAGAADPVRINRNILAPDPMKNLTPYLGYQVLEARAMANDYPGCLNLVRSYWGAMLDLGAQTFWEDFDIDWTRSRQRIDEPQQSDQLPFPAELGRCASGSAMSLCHAWSAGVSAWLSQHILGIHPRAPGCRVVQLSPEIGDLQFVEGCFPTPVGDIKVRHERLPGGDIQSDVEAPPEITIEDSK